MLVSTGSRNGCFVVFQRLPFVTRLFFFSLNRVHTGMICQAIHVFFLCFQAELAKFRGNFEIEELLNNDVQYFENN